jgi:ubiquinone/menaquinone biosynthesis C-methylase UbiE
MSHRKQLLAAVRQGDYAHAGEEEAIEIAMGLIPKRSEQLLLDVGCGLGGTAHYLEQQGWGRATGVDIDPDMVNYAKSHYSHIKFFEAAAKALSTLFLEPKFDVVYSFNAFFCFPEQGLCLNEMAKVAKHHADLIIFDYASPGVYTNKNPFFDPEGRAFSKIFSPINLDTIENILIKNDWELKNIINLRDKYLNWYEWLVEKMNSQKSDLIQKFGELTFDGLYDGYVVLLDLLSSGEVSGAVIHAKRQ